MSTRPNIPPAIVLDAGDMSQATLTSDVTIFPKLSKGSYAFSWTGSTPVGTAVLQFSNDYSVDASGVVKNAGTWNTAPLDIAGALATSVSISGNTGNGFIEIQNCGGYAGRIVYTKGSGTGSLTITYVGKVA